MICPTCNEDDIGEPPWESWHRCANCDVHPETSLHMKAQRERIAALEAKLEAMRRKERARALFDNPPSPHAGLTAWQRWKEETDAAIAAAQEQEDE